MRTAILVAVALCFWSSAAGASEFSGSVDKIADGDTTKKGSNRDQIKDFKHGETIDLRDIDAKTGTSGNNKFKFIGRDDFSHTKGELRYIDKGASCIVQGDVNGDGKVDFEIFVKISSLSKADFLL